VVGNAKGIFLPDLSDFRQAQTRLKGLRYIHTHLSKESLSHDDLMDLALLRLDLIVAIEVKKDGLPGLFHTAHLLPDNPENKNWNFLSPNAQNILGMDFLGLIQSLEEEFSRIQGIKKVEDAQNRAILVKVTSRDKDSALNSLEELKDLALSSGLKVLDVIIQKRPDVDPKFVMGKGKLQELIIRSLQLGADLIVFDQELTPSQIRSIAEATELKVIDRTQLILDIFARRAKSRDGKLQVELAQLKYLLPRLAKKNTMMSRLTGGIGGRGPGETKLEINRRRVRDRIIKLEKEIRELSRQRAERRRKRTNSGIPIVSIVGYTNAGKTTLFNSLTKSRLFVEDKLFATLDPTTRRLQFSTGAQIIITDTVGFIQNLPEDLINAFRATLEELEDADLLIHVEDISHPLLEEHISAVEKILADIGLAHIPRLLVLNKEDKVSPEEAENLCLLYNAISISAIEPTTLGKLLDKIEEMLWPKGEIKREYHAYSAEALLS